jgi:hypothetical protein
MSLLCAAALRRTEEAVGLLRAVAAGEFVLGEQISQSHAAAGLAARDADLIAPRQRQQQEPGVFERDQRRYMKIQIGLVGSTQLRT